jgi:hypothetical protein
MKRRNCANQYSQIEKPKTSRYFVGADGLNEIPNAINMIYPETKIQLGTSYLN